MYSGSYFAMLHVNPVSTSCFGVHCGFSRVCIVFVGMYQI